MKNIQKPILCQLLILALTVMYVTDSKAGTEELSLIASSPVECNCPDDKVVFNDLFLKAAANKPDGYDSLLIDTTSIIVKQEIGKGCAELELKKDTKPICVGTCKYTVRFTGEVRKLLSSGVWSAPKKYIYPAPSQWTHDGRFILSDSIWTYRCKDWRGVIQTVLKTRLLEQDESKSHRVYVNIYPNPLNSGNQVKVSLFSDVSDVAYLRIYDINGRESVSHRIAMNVREGMNNGYVDVSGLKPGIYSITIYMNALNVMRKELLIIQ